MLGHFPQAVTVHLPEHFDSLNQLVSNGSRSELKSLDQSGGVPSKLGVVLANKRQRIEVLTSCEFSCLFHTG